MQLVAFTTIEGGLVGFSVALEIADDADSDNELMDEVHFIEEASPKKRMTEVSGDSTEFEVVVRPSFKCQVSHSSLRSICQLGRGLLIGGVDEQIHGFDLEYRSELEPRLAHEGTVTCLRSVLIARGIAKDIPRNCFISGSQIGELKFWGNGQFTEPFWELVMQNSAAVQDICVHPSSKLVIVACLAKWNEAKQESAHLAIVDLVRGKVATTIELKKDPVAIVCDPLGTSVAILFQRDISILNLGTEVWRTLEMSRDSAIMTCIAWPLDCSTILVGDAEGVMRIIRIGKKKMCVYGSIESPTSDEPRRLRAILRLDSFTYGFVHLICVASDGDILFWSEHRDRLAKATKSYTPLMASFSVVASEPNARVSAAELIRIPKF